MGLKNSVRINFEQGPDVRPGLVLSLEVVHEEDGGRDAEGHQDEGVDGRLQKGHDGAEHGDEENLKSKILFEIKSLNSSLLPFKVSQFKNKKIVESLFLLKERSNIYRLIIK